jgi:hypothetical protein
LAVGLLLIFASIRPHARGELPSKANAALNPCWTGKLGRFTGSSFDECVLLWGASLQHHKGPLLLRMKGGEGDENENELIEAEEDSKEGHLPSFPEGTVPEDAPEACPGTASDKAGKSQACAGCPNQATCASGMLCFFPMSISSS